MPVEVERRGEGVVTISGEDHAALRRVRLADELSGEGLAVHVAVVGENRKVLVFAIDELPEMGTASGPDEMPSEPSQ